MTTLLPKTSKKRWRPMHMPFRFLVVARHLFHNKDSTYISCNSNYCNSVLPEVTNCNWKRVTVSYIVGYRCVMVNDHLKWSLIISRCLCEALCFREQESTLRPCLHVNTLEKSLSPGVSRTTWAILLFWKLVSNSVRNEPPFRKAQSLIVRKEKISFRNNHRGTQKNGMPAKTRN